MTIKERESKVLSAVWELARAYHARKGCVKKQEALVAAALALEPRDWHSAVKRKAK